VVRFGSPTRRRRPDTSERCPGATVATRARRWTRTRSIQEIQRVRDRVGRRRAGHAYYAAIIRSTPSTSGKRFIRAYLSRAYRFYRPPHIERGIGMILKATG